MPKFKDLIGKRFGRLMVIKISEERCKDRGVKWICLCDCGETKVISAKMLRSGDAKSCGCFQKETYAKLKEKKKDLTGYQFGKLVVIKESDYRDKHGRVLFLCKCECGKQKQILSQSLVSGGTSSCGCARVEAASKEIERRKREDADYIYKIKNKFEETKKDLSFNIKQRAGLQQKHRDPIFRANRRMAVQQYHINKKLNFQCIKVEENERSN